MNHANDWVLAEMLANDNGSEQGDDFAPEAASDDHSDGYTDFDPDAPQDGCDDDDEAARWLRWLNRQAA